MSRSIKDVKTFLFAHQIQMIDFKMIDLDGRWHHLTIPAGNFNEETLKFGIGFDGSNYGYAPVECSDMVFIPDTDSLVLDPFAEVPTAVMMGDVQVIGKKNMPFNQYPRNVIKSAADYLRSSGVADEMIIGPEFEFYLFDSVSYQTDPNHISYTVDTRQASWNTVAPSNGYQIPSKAGYHADIPRDITSDLRSRMCLQLNDWAVPVKYHHHEVGGSGQVEIEVELGEICRMADATMIVKYIVKNLAAKYGKTATFMPKPIVGAAGSGMHVHMLLRKDGKPVFYDAKGYSELSETAHFFIGGLLKHAASLCGFCNPSTNSYKRLIPGFEAPVTIGYATANRSAVIRIPAYAKSPASRRFELRNPDATCNPYYAYAAILMAGLDGVENRIDPRKNNWGPFDFNLYDLSSEEQGKIQQLPRSLEEALEALEADQNYLTKGGVFPKELIHIWIAKKRQEARQINSYPSAPEFAKYYDL